MLTPSYASAPRHPAGNEERIGRITEEFRAGYALLETITKGVTCFGSSRAGEDEAMYREARTFARLATRAGCTVVTGGGPGIMAAANRGAVDAGGRSVGFNIMLEEEQRNPYVQEGVSFYYLFIRKVMLASAGHAYVFFPGGIGTLDEFFEISTLIHTHKLHEDIPVILVNGDYWDPLMAHLKKVVIERYHAFMAADLRMWSVVPNAEQAFRLIQEHTLQTRLYGRY